MTTIDRMHQMHRAYALNQELAELDDKLSALITETEDLLRTRITISVEYDIGDGQSLAWGKLAGSWRFMIVDDDGHEVALLSCSRQVRVSASASISKLLESIPPALEAMIAERQLALDQATQLVAAIRSIGGKS